MYTFIIKDITTYSFILLYKKKKEKSIESWTHETYVKKEKDIFNPKHRNT